MGLFDFLKQFKKEKTEETKEIKAVELEEFLNVCEKERIKDVIPQLEELKKKINIEKENLRDNLRKLAQTDSKNANFPDRIKQIMEGNRQAYAQKIEALQQKINPPDRLEDLGAFTFAFNATMKKFETEIIKNHRVMQEFFLKETNAIAANVRNIDKCIIGTRKIIRDSKAEKIGELKKKARKLQETIVQKEEMQGRIAIKEGELEKQRNKIKKVEQILDKLVADAEHKKFVELVVSKEQIERQINTIREQSMHFFSTTETAFKKYEKSNQENKDIKAYLANPLKTLLDDNELSVVRLADEIKNAIANNKIDLKEKKKERVLAEIEKCTEQYLKTVQALYTGLQKKVLEIESQIEKSEIDKKINDLKNNIKREKAVSEKIENELEKLEKDFEATTFEVLKESLQIEIEKNIEKIKIKI